MDEKIISVIIPVYNSAKYIENTLISLEQQTMKKFEVILINDGSKDESVSIIKKYIDKSKMDIKLINQFNQNAAVARNRGIEIAKGKFLYFIDSDDYLTDDNIFEKMINEIQDNELLIGNYYYIDLNNNKIGKYKYENDLLNYNNKYKYSNISPVPSNKLFKTEIVKKNNLYFGNVRIGQDLNFFLKYLKFCNTIKCSNEIFYNYRIVSNGMTKKINNNILDIYNSFQDIKNKLARKMIFSYFKFCVSTCKINKENRTIYYKKEMKKYKIKRILSQFHIYEIATRLLKKTKF